MGKGVQQKLKGLHNDIAVLVFYKTDEDHNGAAKKRNDVSEDYVHLIFPGFLFFFNLPDAVSGGNNGEGIKSGGNEIEMNRIINEPHADGEDHHVFEFYNVLAVNHPGEKGSCKNRKPGYGVKSNGSERKNDRKNNKNNFEKNGRFALKENKVSENAYNRCDDSAHSAEKIVGNAHEGELNALGGKNFVFVFDKTDKHHHGAGND